MRQVNLLPEEFQRTEKITTLKNSMFMSFGPVIVLLLVVHFLLSFQIDRLEQMANRPPAPIDTPEIRTLREQISSVKSEMKNFVARNDVLIEILSTHLSSPQILKVIAEVTSNKVWLTGLSFDNKKGNCEIVGKSFNTRLVSEFMLELKKLPYFESVELVNMEKSQVQRTNEVSFKVICNFK